MSLLCALPTRPIALAFSGIVFFCPHSLATRSYGNALLVARLRFAGREAFFSFWMFWSCPS